MKRSFCVLTFFALSVLTPCRASQQPPPVPSSFQDLYTSLQGYLDSFNATLHSSWNGSTYPVLFTGNLFTANANSGPQLIGPTYIIGVQLELQGLKAMGVPAVLVEMPFPMLYEPFFSSQSEYQQFVSFYSQVAASIRALGMKLVVENQCMLSSGAYAGWNVAPFYATLNWDQYQQARAQTAQVIAQTMHPDYMVVLEEPDTEAGMSGQSQVNTVSGASAMLSLILSSVRQAGISGLQVGAGVGTWHPQYLQFTQSFVSMPVDFLDIHIFPVNDGFLNNALTMASTAAAAGKPVTAAETWLWKVRDTELNVLTSDQIMARNPFSFWAPLDAYFVQTMENLANYTRMSFLVPFQSQNFRAYLPYDSSTQNLSPAQILNQETLQSQANIQNAIYTSTGVAFYNSLVSPPDTTPPTVPSNLTGSSGAPTASAVAWNASTDNVGVAGYSVFRNDVQIGTTAATYYQDSGLTGSTTYTYVVVAFDLAGNASAPSQRVAVTTRDVVPPGAPANLVGTAVSCKQINLTWAPATDDVSVGSYRVFRGTAPTGLTQVGTTYSTNTSFNNYPLTPTTKYYFGVETVDTSGNISPMSLIVAVTTPALPSAPANLVATAVSTKQISLSWVAGPSGMPIGAYHVYRGTAPSSLSQVAITKQLTYTDYGLTPATKYYYGVQAVDTGGNFSPMSATVAATTLALPSAPANPAATAVSTRQISLSWAAGLSGMPLLGYYIFRGSSPSGLTRVASVGPASYQDYGLNPATKYYYAVQALDSGGNLSPMSPTVSATTLALPSAPASVAATAVSKVQVKVTWSVAQSGMPLASYRIFRGSSTANLTQRAVVRASQTSFTDYPVTAGTTYYYALEAVDTGGNVSTMSAAAAVTTPN